MPQSVRLERDRVNFTLSGPDVEPMGVEWLSATRDERAKFWGYLATEVYDSKMRSLSRGLDRFGAKIVPAKPESRERYKRRGLGYTGPGLMPQRALSRTRRYLRVMVYPQRNPDRVVGHWLHKWGRILGYHARGEVRGAPVRDVVGLSDDQVVDVVRKARATWYRAEGRAIQARLAEDAAAATRTTPPPTGQRVPAVDPRGAKWTREQLLLIERYPEMEKYLRPAGGIVGRARRIGAAAERAVSGVVGAARRFGSAVRGLFGRR